ncbi:hypothetical protein ACTD5D_22005 [Nocardia takedensis]|uniref:hypothetical protein n=1 Tax=Nocardia takedensis TaxID=259390 RepID=UPI003F761F05
MTIAPVAFGPAPVPLSELLPSAVAAIGLAAFGAVEPRRASAELAARLSGLSSAQWAYLGSVYRGHAHSPVAALARVLALGDACPRAELHHPSEEPVPGQDIVEAGVEIEAWARRPLREPGYDLRLEAEPSAETEARRTSPDALARRARHRRTIQAHRAPVASPLERGQAAA